MLMLEVCPLDRTGQVDWTDLGTTDDLAKEAKVYPERRTSIFTYGIAYKLGKFIFSW
jgi:hypothetical protein